MLSKSNGKASHVVMCVSNDTVTRSFSGHTNDRLKFAYSSDATFESAIVDYYTVKI